MPSSPKESISHKSIILCQNVWDRINPLELGVLYQNGVLYKRFQITIGRHAGVSDLHYH